MKKGFVKNIKKKKVIYALTLKLFYFIEVFEGFNQRIKRIIFIGIDFLIIIISILFVNYIYLDNNQSLNNNTLYFWNYITALTATLLFNSIKGQKISLSRYIPSSEIFNIIIKNTVLILCTIFIGLIFDLNISSFKSYFLLFIIISFTNIFYRFSLKEIFNKFGKLNSQKLSNVVIYGAGAAGAQLGSALILERKKRIIAFIDDSPDLWGRKLLGVNIHSADYMKNLNGKVDQILVAIPSLNSSDSRMLLKKIYKYEIPVLKVPSIESLTSGIARIDSLRPIQIVDLLGRGQVKPNIEYLKGSVNDLNICITGAGGSIGKELCRQILKLKPKKIILLDLSEPSLYYLQQEINDNRAINEDIEIFTKLANVQDFKMIKSLFEKFDIDVVFHSAAYKHVPLIEDNPLQGIKNNILATLYVCKAAELTRVKQVTLISTDKAVRPTNVLGASKRVAELICQAFANKVKRNKQVKNRTNESNYVKYSIVRFGNVLNSSGSVVPLFEKQIAKGGPVTVTDKNIIRYFMTIPEAAQLVIQANYFSSGGDIFLLDMGEPVKIYDLAKQMIRLSGLTVKDQQNPDGQISIITTGLRPGEKLFEELLVNGKSQKTLHPLIFKADETFTKCDEFFNEISLLEKALNDLDIEDSLNILSKLVPEWKRNG